MKKILLLLLAAGLLFSCRNNTPSIIQTPVP